MEKRGDQGIVLVVIWVVLAVALSFPADARTIQKADSVDSTTWQPARFAGPSLAVNNRIAEGNQRSYQTGFEMIQVMFHLLEAQKNEEAGKECRCREMAIVELVYLVDRLEGQPQAAQLQRVLKMTVRETGTVEQLWAAMRNAIALHRESLQGEARWYFRAGVIVPGIMLNTYAGDAPRLRAELYDLQQLVQDAPRGMPAAVLAPMRQLAKYAAQATYSQDDLVAIASISGNIMKALES